MNNSTPLKVCHPLKLIKVLFNDIFRLHNSVGLKYYWIYLIDTKNVEAQKTLKDLGFKET